MAVPTLIKRKGIFMNTLCGQAAPTADMERAITANGCPFGKQRFIHSYIKTGGVEAYEQLKLTLMGEFNGFSAGG